MKGLWKQQCDNGNTNLTELFSIEINSRRTKLMLFWVTASAKWCLMVTFFMSSWLDNHQNCFFTNIACLMPIMGRFCMTGHLHWKLQLHRKCFAVDIIPTLWHAAIASVGSKVPQWVTFSIICTLLLILSARNRGWARDYKQDKH